MPARYWVLYAVAVVLALLVGAGCWLFYFGIHATFSDLEIYGIMYGSEPMEAAIRQARRAYATGCLAMGFVLALSLVVWGRSLIGLQMRLDARIPLRSEAPRPEAAEPMHATICVDVGDELERTTVDQWFEKWGDRLTRSEDRGCGCCVNIWSVEGPRDAFKELPQQVLLEETSKD